MSIRNPFSAFTDVLEKSVFSPGFYGFSITADFFGKQRHKTKNQSQCVRKSHQSSIKSDDKVSQTINTIYLGGST